MYDGIETPHCPRCGYDQSGAIAAWERNDPPSCPLTGTCSECGLHFCWRDLLNPMYMEQGRMFEHALDGLAKSFILTWWKSLRPWSLWDWLRMEYHVVWPRLRWFTALTFALNIAAMIVLVIFAKARLDSFVGWWVFNTAWSDEWRFRDLTDPSLLILRSVNYDTPAPWLIVSVLAVMAAPLSFLLLPATLRRARVRGIHIRRIWAYGLAWLPIVLLMPPLLVILAAIATVTNSHYSGPGYFLAGLGVWLYHNRFAPGLLCLELWLALWWGTAAGRYLRLPHGLAIGLFIAALSLLIAIGLVAIVPGGLHWMVEGL
jgi:hypothetical protein